MRVVYLLAIAAALAAQERRAEADAVAGSKIFRSHCAECHGLKGEGGRAPKLTAGVFFHGATDADLFRNISEGIPGTAMPGVFFSADQVWQIVAYVRTLAQTGSAQKPPGDPQRGASLFREQQCLGCHLVRGEGGVSGPDLSVIGSQRSLEHLRQSILDPGARVLREYWVAKITHENGTAYSGFVMNEDTHYLQVLDFSRGLQSLPKRELRQYQIDKSSTMPAYQTKLKENEVQDLVAYLWSLQRRQGGAQ